MEYCEKCGYIKQQCECDKPMTNADRIRSMTDEELAEWLYERSDCVVTLDCLDDSCDECILKWLKEEMGCE